MRTIPHRTAAGTEVDEGVRLRELLSLRILDTRPEERFDRYTRLAADLFDVPIALISLIDENRQWFKSRVGLDVCETDRDEAFCDQAFASNLLEVPDATADGRFADNPLVTGDPYIRFYAGAVLRGPSGQPMGTLCLIDRRPRRLTPAQRRHLAGLAELVEGELLYNVELDRTRSELARRVLRDPLTALAGPLLIELRGDERLQALDAATARLVALQLHVRNLDDINRVYGRDAGDELLRALVARLARALPADAEIGRLSGSRFLALMDGPADSAALTEAVAPLETQLVAPVAVAGQTLHPQAAMGIAVAPPDADSAGGLIERSARALRDADGEPGARLHFYSPAATRRINQRKAVAFRLAEAVATGSLSVAYQPIVRLGSGALVGVEALVRWRDAQLGAVSAADFIPQVEADADLSRELTRFVLDRACRAAAPWPGLSLSVNVPGGELHRADFTAFVLDTVLSAGFPPDRLTLELTEQTLITDVERAAGKLRVLANAGVRAAVDDFGTGYSSLSYLRRLPVQLLKMDRSFVTEVVSDPLTARVARGIVDIARSLSLTVVAEGVETEGQLAHMQELGCELGQGFVLGHPVAAEAITDRLARSPDGERGHGGPQAG